MERLKWEQQRDERLRQQIKENRFVYIHIHTHTAGGCALVLVTCAIHYSLELRELEARLKAGYMNRERAAQLAEKQVLKKKDEVRTHHTHAHISSITKDKLICCRDCLQC